MLEEIVAQKGMGKQHNYSIMQKMQQGQGSNMKLPRFKGL